MTVAIVLRTFDIIFLRLPEKREGNVKNSLTLRQCSILPCLLLYFANLTFLKFLKRAKKDRKIYISTTKIATLKSEAENMPLLGECSTQAFRLFTFSMYGLPLRVLD